MHIFSSAKAAVKVYALQIFNIRTQIQVFGEQALEVQNENIP